MSIEKIKFGTLSNGQQADLYTITNENGTIVKLTNFGGCLVEIVKLDKNDSPKKLIGGYPTIEGYEKGRTFQGALIGRFGNRISNGNFKIGDVEYNVPKNENGITHLHGGDKGFDVVLWNVISAKDDTIVLNYLSKDGEEGYPGNLNVTVTYSLSSDDELKIHYEATTDKATLCNLTNHSYFNLGGIDSGDVLDHILTIESDYITENSELCIPTGNLLTVYNTPFDFNTAKTIGQDINSDNVQLKYGSGYDHNFVLKNHNKFKKVATAYSPKSGIAMDVSTDRRGVQLYTGNFMNSDYNFIGGIKQEIRHAFCLETQDVPDNINHKNFKHSILMPNEKYDATTSYKFFIKE